MVEPTPAAEAMLVDRLHDTALHQRLARIDDLLEMVEQVPGPTSDAALESVQLLVEVYGEALARMLDLGGSVLRRRCIEDELLGHLMVLHELHPDSVEHRVRQVVQQAAALVEDKGVTVELAGVEAGVARIHVVGAGGGCGSCGSGASVEKVLEEAVLAIAPELDHVEQVQGPGSAAPQALIPVEALLRRPTVLAGGS